MKKQLHFLLVVSMLCTASLITAQEGINQNFTDFGDWAVSDNGDGTNSIVDAHVVAVMGLSGTKYRADLKFLAGTNYTINSAVDSIIAVKFIGDKPQGTLKVEMHNATTNTWINRGGGKYTPAGSVTTDEGNLIYYFNYTADANFTAGDIEIDKVNFTIADTVDPTTYTIDWIASFTNVEDLKAYKNALDDGEPDTEGSLDVGVVLGVNDIENSSFNLYPNPTTNNTFSVELNNEAGKLQEFIKVYNLLGSLVLEKGLGNSANKVIVNHNLEAGVYLVKIGASSTKLVVK